MRYEAEHKQRTRERVVQEASAAIRRHGPGKVGVAALMARAGLTHGGFYAHFKSKDDLVLAAISHMFDEQHARFTEWTEGVPPAQALESFIDRYLSPLHRDHPDKGCPVAALSGEVGRMSSKARKGFDAGVSRMVRGIAELIRALGQPDAETLATSAVAEMVGALAIARAVADPSLSKKTLEATKKSVKSRIGLSS
jgi:TetR/AcrR family transcriptional regulator, transcriptional repressor for nem operon